LNALPGAENNRARPFFAHAARTPVCADPDGI